MRRVAVRSTFGGSQTQSPLGPSVSEAWIRLYLIFFFPFSFPSSLGAACSAHGLDPALGPVVIVVGWTRHGSRRRAALVGLHAFRSRREVY